MPSVAEQLRQAREKQNLNIYQVAEVTKIKTDHVRAIEDGNYDCFAAPIYIRGFVRAYASMLRLDVAKVMEDLEAELAQTERFHEPPPLLGAASGPLDKLMLQFSKVHWRHFLSVILFVLIVLLGMAGFWIWQQRKRSDPLRDLGPGLYQPPPTNSGEVLPLPPRPNGR